jgi:hypothetical protein
MAADGQPPARNGPEPALVAAADVALGVASAVVAVARSGTARMATGGQWVVRLLPTPLVRPLQRRLDSQLASLARRGSRRRVLLADDVERAWKALVPVIVAAVLDELDLTAIVRERVDLDAVAKTLDVDAVAGRLDVNEVAERLDIDRVLDRVDPNTIVERVDFGPIIDRVDVDAVAARVDIDAIVARLDLIALADFVVDGIDLPGIIRESSGSMASEALSGVRLQSLEADEAVSRMIGRWLPRHRAPKDEPERQP